MKPTGNRISGPATATARHRCRWIAKALLLLATFGPGGGSAAAQDAPTADTPASKAPGPSDSPSHSLAPSVVHSIGMALVRVRSGSYFRGFDGRDRREHAFFLSHRFSNRQNFNFEQPAHRVRIGKPFEIGATEVTVGQFRAFVEATGYVTDAERGDGALGCFPDQSDYVDRFHTDASITWRTPGFEQTDEHPVVAVSWQDAQAFCQWLSDAQGAVYRLPTEAEWEYACRAGTTDWYAWGTDPDQAYDHANVADAALEAAQPNTTRYQRAVGLDLGQGDGFVFTAPVASFRANAWGLSDMQGNVWEWCQDQWAEDAYEQFFAGVPRRDWDRVVVNDPVVSDQETRYGDWRVIRGGAWTCAPAAVRCSIRTFAERGDAAVYTGFRVVREIAD